MHADRRCSSLRHGEPGIPNTGIWGLPSKTIDAISNYTQYGYDGYGNPNYVAYTKSGNAHTDGNGNSDNVTLAYYPDSLLQTMTDYTDTTTWTYDNAGNTLSVGGPKRGTVSYTYWNDNLRQSMSESSSAEAKQTWQYNYDNANRPANITDPFGQETQFAFDQADRLTSKTFANGIQTTYGYDSCNEVQSVRTATSVNTSPLFESDYTYDPAGNVTTRTDNDGTMATFLYNGADQLTLENYLQNNASSYLAYTYDHNGSRTTQNYNGSLTTYAYNSTDELTSDGTGGTYSYDADGNWTGLTSGGSTYAFTYDAENRLIHYTAPTTASYYSYNGLGLRVTEFDSGSGEHDLLNDGAAPASSLLIDHNLAAKTVNEVYTPGLEQRDGLTGALHLMGVDALGTVRAFINDDAGQAVTDTFGAYAYGNPRNRTGSDAFTFAFAGADGYQTDPNGLILLGNRVYHVYTGRFLTRDPAGAGDNDYEYADDNPLRYVDPSGLYPQGVVDHPGPANNGSIGSNDWFDGDDFDAVYGSSTGNGSIHLSWVVHTHWTVGNTTYCDVKDYSFDFTPGGLLSPFYWVGAAGSSGNWASNLWKETKTTASSLSTTVKRTVGTAVAVLTLAVLYEEVANTINDFQSKASENEMIQAWYAGHYPNGEAHSDNTDDLQKQYDLFRSQWGEYAANAAQTAADVDRRAYGYGGR